MLENIYVSVSLFWNWLTWLRKTEFPNRTKYSAKILEECTFHSMNSYWTLELLGRFQGIWEIWEIYIWILMMQFCSVRFHICLCKKLRVSNTKYGQQRTNLTNNRPLVGPTFFINIAIKSIHVVILAYFWDEHLMLWATEN